MNSIFEIIAYMAIGICAGLWLAYLYVRRCYNRNRQIDDKEMPRYWAERFFEANLK